MSGVLGDIDLAPLFAILGILIPLGVAYVILVFQSRHMDDGFSKVPVIASDELEHEHEREKLFQVGRKHAAR